MADEEQVKLLLQGVDGWNAWRERPDPREINLTEARLYGAKLGLVNLIRAKLGGANLSDADLSKSILVDAKLGRADLSGADLSEANLGGADLRGANLNGANLNSANLGGTDLVGADLNGANLRLTYLGWANLTGAALNGTDLQDAILLETLFGNVDLSAVIGLETCRHTSASVVDFRTLQRSGPLPLKFLRGVGLPDTLIDYLPSLLNRPIQMYSCFISYSSKDDDFAQRLHADLQNKSVRCWFAPHDLPIGAKIWDAIDAAIRVHDKVLLILSENSILSDWVEDEVNKAFAEERDKKRTVLFPVRIDDAVMDTSEPWARKLRDQRNIGDFTRWKTHDAYQKSLDRLLRDLAVKTP